MKIFKKLTSLYFLCKDIQALVKEINLGKNVQITIENKKVQDYLINKYKMKLFELDNILNDIDNTPVELSYFVAFAQIVKDKGVTYSTLLNIYNFSGIVEAEK